MKSAVQPRVKRLLDLDDQCMQLILRKLEPIPDRFNASTTCKRLLRLCCDSKLWISVQSEDGPDAPPSRPGDSIHLGPGEHTAEGVQIHHPLRLIGAAGSTLRCRKHYADAALELWSNVKLEGVCVEAHRAFCVRHHAGDVTLSRCRLICDAGRFSHLYCAVVAAARQREGDRGHSKTNLSACRPAGSLTVEETTILGALRAVQCNGDGELHDVRMLQGWGGLCFWFKVEQVQLTQRQVRSTKHSDSCQPVLSSAALKKRKMQWDIREWHNGASVDARCQ